MPLESRFRYHSDLCLRGQFPIVCLDVMRSAAMGPNTSPRPTGPWVAHEQGFGPIIATPRARVFRLFLMHGSPAAQHSAETQCQVPRRTAALHKTMFAHRVKWDSGGVRPGGECGWGELGCGWWVGG